MLVFEWKCSIVHCIFADEGKQWTVFSSRHSTFTAFIVTKSQHKRLRNMILSLPMFGERQTPSLAPLMVQLMNQMIRQIETALFIEVLKSKNIQMCDQIQVLIVLLVKFNCQTVSHVWVKRGIRWVRDNDANSPEGENEDGGADRQHEVTCGSEPGAPPLVYYLVFINIPLISRLDSD